jgi:phasin
MNGHDQSGKFAHKSATIPNETLEKGKAAVEQSAQAVEKSYSVTVENIRALNVKMIEMARANAESVFDLALQIVTAASPSDISGLWTTHARKQFEMLSEQTKELTALGQKMAGECAAPMARSVNLDSKKAS